MKLDLALTFLELGDATSRNLEFCHRKEVLVSYGEETITESNLLEIRRRHAGLVRVHTFTRRVEATNGSDWGWHIVGLKWTLRMRVQAKRLQKNGVLKVRHTVRTTGREQRDLLIDEAVAVGMKPIYCIYCTEEQRNFWKQPKAMTGYSTFQTGCLLADAEDMPPTTLRLGMIEKKCRPWHHLFAPEILLQKSNLIDGASYMPSVLTRQLRVFPALADELLEQRRDGSGWNPPTIDDLNGYSDRVFDETGVRATTEEDLARLEPGTDARSKVPWSEGKQQRHPRIHRLLKMDVRAAR